MESWSHTLEEELEKLYLWGESFENGDLDRALEQSEDLRDIVLELLSAIGDTIIQSLTLQRPINCVASKRNT